MDYHLRRAGFLQQLEIFNRQQRSNSNTSHGSNTVPAAAAAISNAVLKTEQEKLIAKQTKERKYKPSASSMGQSEK